jgi:hypothetical protein
MRMDELPARAIEVVERDEVRIVPDNYKRVPSTGCGTSALVHLAPAVVGPSHSGVVLRRLR